MRQRFRDLAAPLKHHNFRMVWIAQIFSEVGDWAARVALTVLIYRKTHSAVLESLVFALGVLPWIGIGQYLSAVADRFNRRFVMVVCDLARAGIFLAMVVPQPTFVLLLLSFAAAIFTPPFESTRAAILPESVPEELYPDAVSLSSSTFQFTTLVGLAVGSAFADWLGPRVALAINAASFAASAVVLSLVRRRRGAEHRDREPSRARDGFLAVWGDPIVRWLAGLCIVVAALAAAAEAQATVFKEDLLPHTKFALAILFAVVPLGTLVTAVVFNSKGRHRVVARRAASVALVGTAVAIAGFSMSGWPLLGGVVGFFGVGITFACTTIAGAVFGQRLPANRRAAGFSVLHGGLAVMQGVGAAVGGTLSDALGVRQACFLVVVIAGSIAVVGVVYVPRDNRGRFDLSPFTSEP